MLIAVFQSFHDDGASVVSILSRSVEHGHPIALVASFLNGEPEAVPITFHYDLNFADDLTRHFVAPRLLIGAFSTPVPIGKGKPTLRGFPFFRVRGDLALH